ncbi:MAG: hypothetical protein VW495_05560, partial [Rhodobiaceae bacterium]
MHKQLLSVAAAATMTLAVTSAHAERWDMPMAYAATNFHSEMGIVFADKVRDYTGGKIDIITHPASHAFRSRSSATRQA